MEQGSNLKKKPTIIQIVKEAIDKYAKEILLDQKTYNRGIFNRHQVETLLNNKENVDYDFWGKKIWMLINVELWARNSIDIN